MGYNPNAGDRYEAFYNLLAEGKLSTNDEAARYFFGNDKDGTHTEYRNFRNSFFKRLVNTFFFIDLKKPEFNDAQQAQHTCYRNMAAIKMLLTKGARHAGYELVQKTLEPALKYEVTDVVMDLARYLHHYYSYVEQDLKKKEHFLSLMEENRLAFNAILKAETYYCNLLAHYTKSKSSKPWVSNEARGYLTELEPLVEKYPLQKLYLYYYLILSIERASVHDHEGTADVCRKAIKYFEGRFATTNVLLAGFAYTLITSLTMLGQYDEAEEWAEYSENLTDDGVPNWFKGLEQQMALQFHKQDYLAAFAVYQKASSHKHFGHLATIEQQTWKLHEAYIQLLIVTGKIKPTEAERKKSGFSPTKFLNEVPDFSKDKRGMNIPVLIVHGVFLLHLKRHDEAYDRFLALDKYADRNLKEGDDAFRSFCFIKALLQIQKADFKRKDSEEKAADWLRRMSSQPIMLADAPHEVESIPYEHIWGFAMEALEQSKEG